MKNEFSSFTELLAPQNINLERQVLVDAITSPEALDDMIALLPAEAFTNESRSKLWTTISDLWRDGDAVGEVVLHERCGKSFIDEIVLPSANGSLHGALCREAIQHAKLLHNLMVRRRLHFAALDLVNKAADPSIDEITLCSEVEAVSQRIQGDGYYTDSSLEDGVKEIRERMHEIARLAAEGKKYRATSGLPCLDWTIGGGFEPGNLIVLAARPSVGKTAILCHFAASAARAGFPATIFSLEQTSEELAQRFLLSSGKVAPHDIFEGCVNDRFEAAAADFVGLPVFVNERLRRPDDIISRMTQQVRKGRCKIAFIDYLGLMAYSMPGNEPLYQKIGKITSDLKAAAKRLKLPIVLLCQLNRDAVRDGRAPELYDLRDSGSIEQDADIVIMLHAEKAINPTTGYPNLNLTLRKNRKGRRDVTIAVETSRYFTSFKELGVIDNTQVAPYDLPTDDGIPAYFEPKEPKEPKGPKEPKEKPELGEKGLFETT